MMKSACLLSIERHPHLKLAFWAGDMVVAQGTEKRGLRPCANSSCSGCLVLGMGVAIQTLSGITLPLCYSLENTPFQQNEDSCLP